MREFIGNAVEIGLQRLDLGRQILRALKPVVELRVMGRQNGARGGKSLCRAGLHCANDLGEIGG